MSNNNLSNVDNPKVSVIIPVYNVEEYLSQCLDSVINQTLEDIEIICIDDGSTDNSPEVLEEYAQKDSRIKVFRQSNKGPGATRNVGIGIASGKYIYFVDGDDFIDLNTLEINYNVAEEKSLDLTMFQLLNYDDEKNEFYHDDLYDMDKLAEQVNGDVFNYKDVTDLLFSLPVTAYNKIYNRQFILDNDVRFSEGLIFEDNTFHYKSFLSAERVCFIEKHLYNRRRRQESITSLNNERYFDVIEITEVVFDIFRELNLFDEFEERLFNFYVSNIFVWYDKVDSRYKEEFYLKIKEHFNKYSELLDDYDIKLHMYNKIIFKAFIESSYVKEFELRFKIESLKNDIRLSNEKIESLKNEKIALNRKNKILKEINHSILTSTSWKVTAIFRKIYGYIKKT